MQYILGALLIMVMRITDVTIGTVRTLMVVQGKKAIAGILGFFEVTIWILAASQVINNVHQSYWFIFGYSGGFAIGNVLGIWVEQKFGVGFVSLYIISLTHADKIAAELRKNKIGVTALPGEGGTREVSILIALILRKKQKEVIRLIESIDPKAFITVQNVTPYRGYLGQRK